MRLNSFPARVLNATIIAVILLCSTAFAQISQEPKKITDLRPTVLLVSIDGFRPDYLDDANTPNLHALMKSGVQGSLIPCFPTETFPNHYSIVTGLYPAEHGIVANKFHDPQFANLFKPSDAAEVTNSRWWGGEPIWITAEKQNQHTGIMYWPGSEAAIKGVRPSHFQAYDKANPAEARVATVLNWIDLPVAQRPTFLSLYFEEVDTAGHHFRLDSDQVKQAIAHVDSAIGKLIEGLQQRGIAEKINMIFVSDHGMAAVSRNRTVILDDYVDLSRLDVVEWGSTMLFQPKREHDKDLIDRLGRVPHLKIYAREQTPARWHYRNNARITPYVGIVDEGWVVGSRHMYESDPEFPGGGRHGYDNNLLSMRALFLAHGPAFTPGSKLDAVENINIYSLIANLLELKPAKNEGNWQAFAPVLKTTASRAARAR